MNSPKISVIIPVYKVEAYLCQCLDSVVNQTYRNLEIIIIDDGSPDNCGWICDEYGAKDERITVIHKKNEGLSAARNDGIKRATGEYLTFVDSDDWCSLDYYEQVMLALGNKNVDIFCAGGHYNEYRSHTVVASTFSDNSIYSRREEMDGLMTLVLNANYDGLNGIRSKTSLGAPWDKLYRTAFIKKVGLWFDTTSEAWEDLWFNFQAFDKTRIVGGCTYIGYHYRMVDTSITKGFNIRKPEINYMFISKLHTYMKDRKPNANIQEAIDIASLRLIQNALQVTYFNLANERSYKENACEINKMKAWPFFNEAIHSRNNRYLSKKQYVFKLILRITWIWPLKFLYDANDKMRAIANR